MVEVLKTGMFDTIQDEGRIGFREFGVPISGTMDNYAAFCANSILGNDSNAAVIECTASGPKLKFHQDTVICIAGGHMSPKLNTSIIAQNKAVSVTSGDILSFGILTYGFRTYVAVFGGFQTECVMRSRSMYPMVVKKSRLIKGDFLPILPMIDDFSSSLSSVKINQDYFKSKEIPVYKGPEFNKLRTEHQELIFHQEFTISKDSNRMAYQLDQGIENQLTPIITSLVLPGTVQLTPSGKLMILMRDSQTTGGYPRVLQLSESAINSLSQKNIGAVIRFKCINW